MRSDPDPVLKIWSNPDPVWLLKVKNPSKIEPFLQYFLSKVIIPKYQLYLLLCQNLKMRKYLYPDPVSFWGSVPGFFFTKGSGSGTGFLSHSADPDKPIRIRNPGCMEAYRRNWILELGQWIAKYRILNNMYGNKDMMGII